MKDIFKALRHDLPSGLVTFLVALPLCLGVGLASTNVETINGLPNVFSGIIAGIIGGIVVGFLSGSRIGVSGPAAGLITILIAALTTLGSFEGLLVAIVLSGIIQIIAGFAGLGVLANYFPSSVIKGMLAAIGLTLILKEIPHALGYDKDFIGDDAFFQLDGHNTFSEMMYALNSLQPGAIVISIVSIGILLLFERPYFKKIALFKILPGALFAVVIAIVLNIFFQLFFPAFAVGGKHLVELPVLKSLSEISSVLSYPDFTFLTNPNVYIVALTLAFVGSLETLLSVDATDKLDPEKHHTPTNRELKAQGVGNIISGLIGGLPITQVIVRSSANINAGAKTKSSTILHGLLLLIAVLFLPKVINLIPLSCLAAILILVGYKLSRVQLYKQLYHNGYDQFIPFLTTIAGILFTDLLRGIGIGMAFSIFYILRKNFRNNYSISEKDKDNNKHIKIILSEEVTFLNKGRIKESLDSLPNDSFVTIDGSNCESIDFDVLELIQEFKLIGSKERNIQLITINIPEVESLGGH